MTGYQREHQLTAVRGRVQPTDILADAATAQAVQPLRCLEHHGGRIIGDKLIPDVAGRRPDEVEASGNSIRHPQPSIRSEPTEWFVGCGVRCEAIMAAELDRRSRCARPRVARAVTFRRGAPALSSRGRAGPSGARTPSSRTRGCMAPTPCLQYDSPAAPAPRFGVPPNGLKRALTGRALSDVSHCSLAVHA
jgi:hypothetical protein